MEYPFKIHLRGIIDLLSKHLYSGPQVFLRELLQNGVDAIRARAELEPGYDGGEIAIEVMVPRGKARPALVFVDDGIGLTDEEIHRFLSTIGESSKRGGDWDRPVDFLGQFGIGLLSCFIVSDEIVVLTRSARHEDAPTIEWRGRPDGTYSVKTLDQSIAPGTQVYLTCKPGSEEFFAPEQVRESAARYGGLLPIPVRVTVASDSEVINAEGAPGGGRSPPRASGPRRCWTMAAASLGSTSSTHSHCAATWERSTGLPLFSPTPQVPRQGSRTAST